MFSRRDFLRSAGLVALAPTVPEFVARTVRAAAPKPDARVLVVVQLDGGNDGINSVVPFADEGYAKHRRSLRLPRERLVKVNDSVGLHPSLGAFGKLHDAGQLSVVQGVGYPNPSRSHFQSMAIWHTARPDAEDRVGLGWLGQALDGAGSPVGTATLIGSGPPPVALRGRRAVASALARLEDFAPPGGAAFHKSLPAEEADDDLSAFVRRSMVDAHATAGRLSAIVKGGDGGAAYPGTALAGRLRLIARLLKAGMGARVYYTLQAGYDTHADQLNTHSGLLFELAGAVAAFIEDLKAAKLADRVCVLAFSEFGRTIRENGSAGTDHGTAGPVFLAGPGVKGGLVGATPRLVPDAKHGDLTVGLDFRRVYAAVLEGWLGLPARGPLGGPFEGLPLFRKAAG
jgi:uncharacterized protein (DUF1501 family)